MKYLVTGGAGFIGSHIADALVEAGHAVTVLDNLSSGHKENLSRVWSRIAFIEGDVRDSDICLKASAGCDGIFHEAALVSVADSVERPRDNHEINLTGTLNVLEGARVNHVKRMVFASSAAVYGDDRELPKCEDMLPDPQTPYATAKITGEYYLRTYAKLYGLEGVALRYFNVFGPRQDPSSPYSGVISIFATRVRQGLPVTVFGDGAQTRDFVHVRDVVMANLFAMGIERQGVPGLEIAVPQPGGDTENGPSSADNDADPENRFALFNVATGQKNSLLHLLTMLDEIAGQRVERHFAPARSGDIRHSLGSSSRLQAHGWAPGVGFRDGLDDLLAHLP